MIWVLLVLCISQKSPQSLSCRTARAELRWATATGGQGVAKFGRVRPTLHCPPKAIGIKLPLGGLQKPGHAVMESLIMRHELQWGLFRVYPAPIMENFPLLPAIALFFIFFFLSSLFSHTVKGSCSALLIRGWL